MGKAKKDGNKQRRTAASGIWGRQISAELPQKVLNLERYKKCAKQVRKSGGLAFPAA